MGSADSKTAPASEADEPRVWDGLFLEHHSEVRRQLLQTVLSDELFHPNYDLSIPQLRKVTHARALALASKGLFSARDLQSDPLRFVAAFETLCTSFYDGPALGVKVAIQYALFAGTLCNLGTARHEHLVDRAETMDLLGCFAMTELGCGSNVRMMRTTATYDQATDEIVVHTPRPEAEKYWIGGAAVYAEMAVVFARLIVCGEDQGPHAVVVPIRDGPAGEPLPGVGIRDCGAKLGLNGIDNGAIRFDRVRVPRNNLLDRFGDIVAGGPEKGVSYVSPFPSKAKRLSAMIGELLTGRTLLACGSAIGSRTIHSLALIHALRRKQFGPPHVPRSKARRGRKAGSGNGKGSGGGGNAGSGKDKGDDAQKGGKGQRDEGKDGNDVDEDEEEVPLLFYATHRRRLLPGLAAGLAYGAECDRLKCAFEEARIAARGETPPEECRRALEDVETQASALKAVLTWHLNESIVRVRECLGGMGYARDNIAAHVLPDVNIYTTFEGDNTVLLSQVAQRLLKRRGIERGIASRDGKVIGPTIASLPALVVDGVSRAWEESVCNNFVVRKDCSSWHLREPSYLVRALGYRETVLVDELGEALAPYYRNGVELARACRGPVEKRACIARLLFTGWARNNCTAVEAAIAHVDAASAGSLFERAAVLRLEGSAKEADLMEQCAALFALSRMEKHILFFVRRGYVSPAKAEAISKEVGVLCSVLAAEVVTLLSSVEKHLPSDDNPTFPPAVGGKGAYRQMREKEGEWKQFVSRM